MEDLEFIEVRMCNEAVQRMADSDRHGGWFWRDPKGRYLFNKARLSRIWELAKHFDVMITRDLREPSKFYLVVDLPSGKMKGVKHGTNCCKDR